MSPRKGTVATSPPRRRKPVTKAPTPKVHRETVLSRWIRSLLRFIGATVLSLVLSSLLFSWAIPITRGDLAWTSKRLDSWWHVAGLLAWRVVELGVPWVLRYDSRDVVSLAAHSLMPTYILLSSFYGIRPTTILTVSAINVFCIVAPFIFRSPNPIRLTPATSSQQRPAVQDTNTAFYTTIFATLIYTIAIYMSYSSWVPIFLINHFDGLPDLRSAHEGATMLLPTFLTYLPAGFAARDFLLVSSAGHPRAEERGPAYREQPGELLISSLYHRYWVPRRTKTKILVKRTAVLAMMIMANTVVQLLGTINGADLKGSLGWAGIWTVATVTIAAAFSWMEAVD